MTIAVSTKLRRLSGRMLFALTTGLIAPHAPALETNATDAKVNTPVIWYCHLLDDELHHLACSPSISNALPPQFVRGPNGRPLLDSLDELLLVQEDREPTTHGQRLVPLFAPPFDVGSIEALARAALCKRDPACSIEISDPGLL